MIEETFSIHGFRLAVQTDASWIADGIRAALQPFASSGSGVDGTMRLAERGGASDANGPVQSPGCGEARAAPAEFRFGGMQCARVGSRLVYSDKASKIVVDPAEVRAEGTMARPRRDETDDRWPAWREPVFTFALLELLRHRGLYHLHAAGVERGGAGVLLAGDTGSGKTTLTLLLARAGWRFLGDDAVLLRLTPERVEARALPMPFHVDPALAGCLPELEGLQGTSPYNQGPKRELIADQIYHQGFCPGVRPALLLLPRIHREAAAPPAEPVGPGLWLRPLAAGQAVAELIRASALVLLDERAAAGHLESLRRLVTGCHCFRLYHGPAALTAPERFADLIDGLLEQAAGRERACAASTKSGSS